ncbi:MAG: ATP-binding protein [Planctomycetota bacterium]
MMTLYSRVPIRYRLAITMVCILLGAILLADGVGLIPSAKSSLLSGRVALAESLAISGTGLLDDDTTRLRQTMQAVVARNESLKSVRLVKATGEIEFQTQGHGQFWRDGEQLPQNNLSVPIFQGNDRWGDLQLAFNPLSGELGWARFGVVGLLLFVAPVCFFQFAFFLKRMVDALNPQGAIPDGVRSLMDTFTEGLVIIDEQERILFANRQLCRATGHRFEDLFGKSIRSLEFEIGDAKPEWPWEEAFRTNALTRERVLRLQTGNSVSTFSVNSNPVPGQGLMATLDDITEIEEHKKQLALALEVAKDASEAKSAFLANMSHEIRTPLNAVLGFTDVLRRGLVTDPRESSDYLNMIHRSGAHLLGLINDILDLSKIEAGRMEVESIPTAVHEVVLDAVNVQSARAAEKQIGLSFEFPTALPAQIGCDPTRLRQILTNLVGNAIKFTDKGAVTVLTLFDPQAKRLSIHVRDTGIGMTVEQQSIVFESFVQADSSTTRKFGGTGLGLSISRRLAEALGGGISVVSRVGEGSVFTIDLPVDSGTEHWLTREDLQRYAITRSACDAAPTLGRLPKQPILVVDDGEANRRLIEVVLSRAGATVFSAGNGQEAIEAVCNNTFSLILMDMQMPVLDGMSATRELRQLGCTVPIVALTGNAMKGDREKCLDAGCDGFLAKPVNLDELLACCQKFLGQGQAAINDAPSELIHSTLPTDDPEIRAVVDGFLGRLDDRLEDMKKAVGDSDFETVKGDAHWLKGSGGTVGFGPLSDRAEDLEKAADDGDTLLALEILEQIQSLRKRIALPGSRNDASIQATGADSVADECEPDEMVETGPIECALPLPDEDYRDIVIDFVQRFDHRLHRMHRLLADANYDELEREAHWLKGSGGTVGYMALTNPSSKLMRAASLGNEGNCQLLLKQIVQIRQRMVVPSPSCQSSPTA